MFAHERKALERIRERLRERLPERIISLYAFGSRVRGDHGEWSDLDVLVIVRNKDVEIEKEIIDIFSDEEFETGIPFAPVIKDIKVFEMEREIKTPFYQDIIKEGVLI
ncbi:MAG: nucleotidyltransferase domain-containing protein [Thermodesulfovibrionales bacterium]